MESRQEKKDKLIANLVRFFFLYATLIATGKKQRQRESYFSIKEIAICAIREIEAKD